MAKSVGLDIGTNSIGWAVVDTEKHLIEAAGSRIIPMDDGKLGDYEKGNPVSFTEKRTQARGARRLYERFLLRRERLLRVLDIMGYLPEHFSSQLTRSGHLPQEAAPRLAWREGKSGKPEFLFMDSFHEMVAEFKTAGVEAKVPYDWTIYYLRTKALTRPLRQEELAWVLMQFNQKRGYYQLRGKIDEEMSDGKSQSEEKFYKELMVVEVEDTGEKDKNGRTWYNIKLENGWVYRRADAIRPDWEGKCRGVVATFKLDKEGRRKSEQPSISSPTKDDWGLRKIKTEQDIKDSGMTVGQFIYNTLLHTPQQKIIGEKVGTIARDLYHKELQMIVRKQSEFLPELRDRELYTHCIEALYPTNEVYRRSIANRDFTYLLVDDILFYQRPLKSKRSLIADCPFEKRNSKPIKCIAKSHPLYQEYRLWQFLANLRIEKDNHDITQSLLPDDEAYANLYDYLSKEKEIGEDGLLRHLKVDKKERTLYQWNYVRDKKYPMGETRATLLNGLQKAGVGEDFLTADEEEHLWHILYSVDDTKQYTHALGTYARKHGWDEDLTNNFIEAFRRLTVYREKDYGAFSAKATSRLVKLMRRGRYWSADDIDLDTRNRIEHLITGEADDSLTDFVRNHFKDLHDISQCSGMNPSDACYLVYNRYSEASDVQNQKWTKPEDIDAYLKTFRRHSLNNPVVEQVVTESLRVVRDIWKQIGHIDEIHIELGRELKMTKLQRERHSKTISVNEATNQRIRLLLVELSNPDCEIANVRPNSPSQQELLRIYEDGVMNSGEEVPDYIKDIQRRFSAAKNQPTHAEIVRYKLWLDQKYRSPYTGKPIPLSRLFTQDYQIEHVIPQSRWFDDSMSNKVICEAEVNLKKGRELGHEFIVNHQGETVPLNFGNSVKILSVVEYEELVSKTFANNKEKRRKLMLDDVPEEFTSSQLNNTRHISRLMMQLLSNIVREEDEKGNRENAVVSKWLIPCNGDITNRLKHEWGMDDVWNRIVLPRFERMNQLQNTSVFTATTNGHTIPFLPLDLRQGVNKKRIDHRHHAMDAIVIACTTRDHVHLLNNEAAKSGTQYGLNHKLRIAETYTGTDGKQHTKFGAFCKPWPTFTEDSQRALESIIVSFKQNLRVINKTSNYYTIMRNGKHATAKQEKGDSWAIRKALHKETVYGEVNLQLKKWVSLKEVMNAPNSIVNHELKEKIKEKIALHYSAKELADFFQREADTWPEVQKGKVEVYYYTKDDLDKNGQPKNRYFATRKSLLEIMEKKATAEEARKEIESITDSGIRAILERHLANEGNNPAVAFSAEGLERMNHNLMALNNGHPHQPIKKVRVYEQANKFSIGQSGQKATKYVEAAKGTNLFFVIYTTDKGTRGYATVPLIEIIKLQKAYEKDWKAHLGERLKSADLQLMPTNAEVLYILSPGDLVYVPTKEEQADGITQIDRNRIYKCVSSSKENCHFLPYSVASLIKQGVEFEASNKMQQAITGEMVKEVCIPIQVDRLGNIINIG